MFTIKIQENGSFRCVECPAIEVPNQFYNACKPIKPEVFEFNSLWVLIPSSFSVLGILATSFVIAVSVYFFLFTLLTFVKF